MLVIAGSASTHATSPGSSAAASASMSLNATDLRRQRRIDRRAHAPFPWLHVPVRVERHERLVDRAVVAPVEDEDLLADRSPGARVATRSGLRRWRSTRSARGEGRIGAPAPRRRSASPPSAASARSRARPARRSPRPWPRGSARSSRRCRRGRSRCTRDRRRPRPAHRAPPRRTTGNGRASTPSSSSAPRRAVSSTPWPRDRGTSGGPRRSAPPR